MSTGRPPLRAEVIMDNDTIARVICDVCNLDEEFTIPWLGENGDEYDPEGLDEAQEALRSHLSVVHGVESEAMSYLFSGDG